MRYGSYAFLIGAEKLRYISHQQWVRLKYHHSFPLRFLASCSGEVFHSSGLSPCVLTHRPRRAFIVIEAAVSQAGLPIIREYTFQYHGKLITKVSQTQLCRDKWQEKYGAFFDRVAVNDSLSSKLLRDYVTDLCAA